MSVKSKPLFRANYSLLFFLLGFFSFKSLIAQVPFTAGNIVVLMVGDSATSTLTTAAYKQYIVELNTSGTIVQKIFIPSTTAGSRSVESGSATSEGDLALSGDGRHITFTGFDAAVGTSGIASAANINRIIGMLDNSAAISFPASYSSNTTNGLYQAADIRSAVTNDGTGFWTAGTGTKGGNNYIPSGTLGATTASTGVVQLNFAATSNTRTVRIFNNQLFSNANSGAYTHPFTVGSGLPTSSTAPYSILSGISTTYTTDGYGFVMFDRNRDGTLDLIYIADNTKGLVKYYLNSGTWTYAGTISAVTSGITGYLDCNNNPVLFITKSSSGLSNNVIYKYTDATSNSTSLSGSLTSIATSGNGYLFRGIALAPTLGDLTVSSNTAASGSYRKIIVNSGTLTLTGNVKVSDSMYIANGATLDCGNYIVSGKSFVLGAGATLKIGDANGITASAATGNIQTNCRVYNSAATYVYEGGAAQVTGDGLPLTVNNLSIYNSSSGVTLTDSVKIINQLDLTNGVLHSTITNKVLMDVSSFAINTSNNSYVDGPIKKYGNIAFTFPVGNNGYYAPISIIAPTLTTDNFTAQYFNTDPGAIYDNTLKDTTINHISGCEYWILNRTGGTSSPTVTLSWYTDASYAPRSCGVTALNELLVAKWDGSMWKDYGNISTTGSINSSGTIVSNTVSSFSPFTLASTTNSNNPLPIELLNFNAVYTGTYVNTDWITASERNNDYFNVERSSDGVIFSSIAMVKGAGNSSYSLNYSLIDKNPLDGISYYRLKQTDFNGNYTYSSIKAVTILNSFSVISVYPIPSDGLVNIELNEKSNSPITIKLFNVLGEMVYESTKMLDKYSSVDISNLLPAVYFFQLSNGNYSYRTTIVKQ